MNRARTVMLLAAAFAIAPTAASAQDHPRGHGDGGDHGGRPSFGGQPQAPQAVPAPPQPAPASPQPQPRQGRPDHFGGPPNGRDFHARVGAPDTASPSNGPGFDRGRGRFGDPSRPNGPDFRRGPDSGFSAPPHVDGPGFRHGGPPPPAFREGDRPGADRPDWQRGRGWQGSGRPDWRADRRNDWRGYRDQHREIFRAPRYVPPRGGGYGYRRLGAGFRLQPFFFAQDYWIGDPAFYDLPPATGPYRWVRYYNDVLLVDLRSGVIVDAIPDFFW